MNWSADEIKQLRYRLGWSQAEMARCLKLNVREVMSFETGLFAPAEEQRNALLMILHQAESNAERVQRRPLADVMMRNQGLSQIHDFDVVENLTISTRSKI